ncbi:hypothetical protein BJ546DRAFT_832950 [Cryomyces antarcticus]
MPPNSWLQTPDVNATEPSTHPSLMSNGKPMPDQSAFCLRLKELLVDNDDAFRVLARTTRPGRTPQRLAHFRKFWEGLDVMSQYWDSSLDDYYLAEDRTKPEQAHGPTSDATLSEVSGMDLEANSGDTDGHEPRKRIKTDSSSSLDVLEKVEEREMAVEGTTQAPKDKDPDVPLTKTLEKIFNTVSNSGTDAVQQALRSSVLPKIRYKGRRTSTGAEMPDGFRYDAVRSFVEGVVWAFGCSVSPQRRPPQVAIKQLLLPTRLDGTVWRNPTDRIRMRQGCLEGPVLGIQCGRNSGYFDGSETKSLVHVLLEVSGLLCLAQERRREGQTEKKPGEGKWWTQTPRWGGGPGGEVGNEAGNSDEAVAAKEKDSKRSSSDKSSRRRANAAESWKALTPASGLWDPRTTYVAVGKDPTVEYDEVYMISSLNHHISILKLTVHPAYIDYLTFGTLPEPLPAHGSWCSPSLQRTKWYDLFDLDDRVGAFRALWGIMSYLMRAQDRAPDRTQNIVMRER